LFCRPAHRRGDVSDDATSPAQKYHQHPIHAKIKA
jgi:hypothetical protein